jgi:hypothetical protein
MDREACGPLVSSRVGETAPDDACEREEPGVSSSVLRNSQASMNANAPSPTRPTCVSSDARTDESLRASARSSLADGVLMLEGSSVERIACSAAWDAAAVCGLERPAEALLDPLLDPDGDPLGVDAGDPSAITMSMDQ